MLQNLTQEIDKCPVCGCEDTIGKQVADYLVEKGWAEPSHKFTPVSFSGPPPIDPKFIPKVLIGSKIPVLDVSVDICANPKCGALYARRLVIVMASRVEPPPNIHPAAPLSPRRITPTRRN